MDERFAAGDADHGRAAFLDGIKALLRRKAFIENMIRILNLAASGAGEVAAEKGFKHQNERIALPSLEIFLGQHIRGDGPGLRDGYHSFFGGSLRGEP
jgi:hypothetical protein